jgi:hypothetical protein
VKLEAVHQYHVGIATQLQIRANYAAKGCGKLPIKWNWRGIASHPFHHLGA